MPRCARANAAARRFPGPRPSAVARTKVLDDALVAAIADGIEQLVILGAGYDSRAYRLQGCARLRVCEFPRLDPVEFTGEVFD